MKCALGLCKPKRAPKCIRVSHSWLWQLVASSASSPKAKSWPLDVCTLTAFEKIVACSTMSEGGSNEVVLGAPLDSIPSKFLRYFQSTNGDYGEESMCHFFIVF